VTDATPLPVLVLYSRTGCTLCDETRGLLDALLEERSAAGRPVPRFEERDIDADPVLDVFRPVIPVVELGDRRLELATSATKLRRLLADVLDG
jgi:Glutaredoxin-like domain (DUF836)